MTETEFKTPFGSLMLQRFPARSNDTLRAWDAADELIVSYLHEQELIKGHRRVLVFNDQFGALTTAICHAAIAGSCPMNIDVMTDSYISKMAITENIERNNLDLSQLSLSILDSLSSPTQQYDLIVYKLPRNHTYLADVMSRLRDFVDGNTAIVGGAMVKYLPATVLSLLSNTIGETTTSLAAKKARLIFSSFDGSLTPSTQYQTTYRVNEIDAELVSYSNVFSRESLDIGTRLLLPEIPRREDPLKIVDLACGNGVIGIVAAQNSPQAELIFCDESYMAVSSARENFENHCEGRAASFLQTDCLTGVGKNSVDMVLCNPPFHQQNTVSEHLAWQMFKQSLQCLKSGGELWIVGNRHLDYHIKLRKLFGNATLVASNKKFVVIKAVKR